MFGASQTVRVFYACNCFVILCCYRRKYTQTEKNSLVLKMKKYLWLRFPSRLPNKQSVFHYFSRNQTCKKLQKKTQMKKMA